MKINSDGESGSSETGRLNGISFSWLDVKLGLRMLAKYPGLSIVSVVGMAVAIAIGAGAFGVIDAMMDSELPLHEGDRVVSIQNNTRNPGNPERRSLFDFTVWRDELSSIQDLAAFRDDTRNLITADSITELVGLAEMTALGFRVARVPPLLGRHILEEDERSGAPPVVVVGFEEWQRFFGGDPEIVGRQVRLGTTMHTVVGVMPEGFRFPVHHRYWVPLRLDPLEHPPGSGPAINIFGRLADGATLESAQEELTTIGARLAAEYPETHEHLSAQVLPYTHPYMDVDSPMMAWVLRGFQLLVGLLLVLVSVNVAVLVYARNATRMGEIAVRSALGASRRRIVTQLFVEALVLSLLAAAIGLAIAGAGLTELQNLLQREPAFEFPFWLELGLSAELVAYVAGLAVLAGVIVGVLPALKATGRSLHAGLQQISSRGSRMQLGRTWTAMIVVQVAIAVAVLPYALHISGQSVRGGTAQPGYPAAEFLSGSLSMEREETPANADAAEYERETLERLLEGTGELLRRLEEEPTVAGVTFASRFPGDESYGRIEVEGTGAQEWIRVNHVDVDLFTVFAIPTLAGRGFVDADGAEGSNTVVVDRVFAEEVFGARDVVGRRLRQVVSSGGAGPGEIEAGPWLEIVGVVPEFTAQSELGSATPRLFRPAGLAGALTADSRLTLAIKMRGGTAGEFGPRLSTIAAGVDPGLQLHGLRTAADALEEEQQILLYVALIIIAVTASVLLLSSAGIYAMMSFTVARRRREIGIRSALGADARRVLTSILARASAQLGGGVLIGLVLAVAVDRVLGEGFLTGSGIVLLPAVAALMVAIGLLAALGPARRGLAVQPTEALREE